MNIDNSYIQHYVFKKFIQKYEHEVPEIDSLLNEIVPLGKVVKYPEHTRILEIQEDAKYFVFILDGYFRLFSTAYNGKEVTLGFFSEGNIIESKQILNVISSDALGFESLTESTVFLIREDLIQKYRNSNLIWYKIFYFNMIYIAIDRYKRHYSLVKDNCMDRYASFVKDYEKIIPFLKNYQVASYLVLTPETLSRVRKKYHQEENIKNPKKLI
jgi:CRP-like cAMP-binding protein